MFPDHTNPVDRPHACSVFVSILSQDLKHFDYLGLRLEPMITMKVAVASIQEKANKGHSLALAVSYSLRYDKHTNSALLSFTRWNAESASRLRPSTLFTLLSLPWHLRCFSRPEPTGQSQQVSQHHNACLRPSHSATYWDSYSLPGHNTEHATCANQSSSPPATIQHFLWQLWQTLLQICPWVPALSPHRHTSIRR